MICIFFSFPPFIKSSMSYISSCFTRIFWVNRPIPKYKRCIILMTHQKIFFCLFQLDRLPKAEVGTDEEKTKLVSQDSKESDVWKKKKNNPPKPLEKKNNFFSPPIIILQKIYYIFRAKFFWQHKLVLW